MRKVEMKSYLIASVAAFVFVFAFDWIFHGVLLQGTYEATQSLWRSKENTILWSMLLGQAILPFVLACIFAKGYEGKGPLEGIRFGILMGVLFAPNWLIMYAVQPLPVAVVAAWVMGTLMEMIGVGLVLSLVYRPSARTTA